MESESRPHGLFSDCTVGFPAELYLAILSQSRVMSYFITSYFSPENLQGRKAIPACSLKRAVPILYSHMFRPTLSLQHYLCVQRVWSIFSE